MNKIFIISMLMFSLFLSACFNFENIPILKTEDIKIHKIEWYADYSPCQKLEEHKQKGLPLYMQNQQIFVKLLYPSISEKLDLMCYMYVDGALTGKKLMYIETEIFLGDYGKGWDITTDHDIRFCCQYYKGASENTGLEDFNLNKPVGNQVCVQETLEKLC